MQILLMRHGEAEVRHRSDSERQLTDLGREQARQSAAWMLNHGYSLDGLFASPYVRAQQSAGEVSDMLDVPISTSASLLPETDPKDVLIWLDGLDIPEEGVIALVCHMPVVARLAGYLCDGSGRHAPGFSLAEVVVIDVPILAAGQGHRSGGFIPY